MVQQNPSEGYFKMASESMAVPMLLFKQNRDKLVSRLKVADGFCLNSVVVVQGGSNQGVCAGDSSDVGPVFRQESYFHWLFGVLEPDFFGFIDVTSNESILFMPRLPEEYAVWMGKIESTDAVKERYRVDQVKYIDEMTEHLSKSYNDPPTLLVLKGINTDSKKTTLTADFPGMKAWSVNDTLLYPILAECRVIKSQLELEVLRYVAKMSSEAHKKLMRQIKPGMSEYQCESIFLHDVYYHGGCRHVCYNCICGSGPSGAILHYGHAGAPNNQVIRDGEMVLFDMGAEYYCFCSDITCSYPVNGKFTQQQKGIYNAVLAANRAVLDAAKPGVSYVDMHLLANRVMLKCLKENVGIITGDVEAMMKCNLAGRLFQPHGLGHFMGCDVHDVGGYLDGHPMRPVGQPGLSNLRTSRCLQAGMVVTVEPGCYFIDHLMDAALNPGSDLYQFIVVNELLKYRGFGGVRIEDDVIITDTGTEVMSVVPRTVQEIEEWMLSK